MSTHEVSVIELSDQTGDQFTYATGLTSGMIEVEPPIAIGPKFGSVVLGKDACEVSVELVGSTDESTILFARSTNRPDKSSGEQRIQEIANRVDLFANDPSSALELMQQNPFPEPNEFKP